MNIHPATNTNATGTLLSTAQPHPISKSTPRPSPVDDLADSMEEISMKFSESVERNSKTLEERVVRPRQHLRIEKLEALYSLLTQQDDRQLDEKVRQLCLMGQKDLSLPQLLTLADGDPALADVIAQHAIHQAKSQNDAPLANHLNQVTQSLYQSHGNEVQAGINTAEALAMFSQNPQQRQNMRTLYYKNIVGQGSLATIFDTLLTQFDEHHFSQGIHTLLRAMTDDLASQFPSMPAGKLRTLLRDLTACQQLSNILNNCRGILQKLATKLPSRTMTPPRLARRLIDFTQSSIYPREIKSLAEDTVGESPLHQTQVLNALYPQIQQMPLVIWKDNKTRQGTLNLMLRMMTEYAHYERQQSSATTPVEKSPVQKPDA